MKQTRTLSILAVSLVFAGAAWGQVKRPMVDDERFDERVRRSFDPVDLPEPPVSSVEKEILQKAFSLLEKSPQYAYTFLQDTVDSGAPVSAAFNNALANIYFQNRNYFLAETQFTEAVTKYPSFQRAWNGLGLAQYFQENYESAAKSLATSIKYGARDASTFGILGYCYLKAGRYRSAEIAYNYAILYEPEETDWAEGIAQIYYDTGRYEEAISVFDDLIRIEPDNTEFWLLKANAWLAIDEPLKTARCIEIARRIGEVDTDSLYLLGNIYLKQGIFQRAREVFVASATEKGSIDTAAALRAVRFLIQSEQRDFAEEIFAYIQAEDENWPLQDKALYRFLAGEFAYFRNELVASAEAYRRGLELDPFNGYALMKLADIEAKQGHVDQAIAYFDRASGDPASRFNALVSKTMLLIDRSQYRYAMRTIEQARADRSDERLDRLYAQVKRVVEAEDTRRATN